MTKEEFVKLAVDDNILVVEEETDPEHFVLLVQDADTQEARDTAVKIPKKSGDDHIGVADAPVEDWPKIRRAIRAHDVTGITRICGYFSRISNWNASKKGELKDRQAGRYSVEGME